MALSPEDKAEIADLLKESLGETQSALETKFTNQLTETQKTLQSEFTNQIGGVMGRTKKEIANAVNGVKTEFTDELSTTLKDLLPQDPSPDNNSDDNNSDSQNSGELSQLAQQIKNQADEMKAMQQKYQEAEEARIKSEEIAKRSQLESNFISKTGEKVVDPRTFMKVLSDNGQIFEQDGQLVAKTGKMTVEGVPEVVPAESFVDNFLSGDYKYFAKIRPGNGGGSDTGGDRAPEYNSKYFAENAETSADDIFNAMKNGKGEEVMEDLGKAIQS